VSLFSKSKPEKEDVYHGLRLQILQGSRKKFGLAPAANRNEPWGVVMDWGLARGSATVTALSDGSASIYLSSGGGSIGGGQSHESIRKAAQNAVMLATKLQATMRATTEYPLPTQDQLIFYVLTDASVCTESASVQDVSSHRHALSALGDAMQVIVTEYRQIQK
jgi:hypothetical protein